MVEERLQGCGTGGLSLLSDRAQALSQLADQGVEYLRLPAGFPVVHALITRSSLALARPLRHAPQEHQTATEARARLQGLPHAAQEAAAAAAWVARRQAEVRRWADAPPVSPSLGTRLAPTAPLPSCRHDSPALRPACKPPAGGG